MFRMRIAPLRNRPTPRRLHRQTTGGQTMTTVVGLDLSLTSAGIAVVSDDRQADRMGVAWPWHLRCCGETGSKDDDYRRRSRRVRRQSAAVMRLLEPAGHIDLAVIEGPIYGGNFMPSYFDRAALFHAVYGALDSRKVPIAVISPTAGHVFTTGKGSLPKDPKRLKGLILDSVRALVPDVHVANDDIADALGLAFMGAMSLGVRMPFRPLRRHHEQVHTTTWPHGRPVVYA
ncbi:RuvC-like resolvase [Mycobacterium phage Hail]|uniref:RuvC-like resolvase n=16 Tax=Caudoviricetes TaxID=2731619 RepID=A0A8T8JC60_9CAUD|nr:RuvC-like Holliday junction resolvase [Mycobacterium phage Giles]QBQ71287.1 hypothetical protein SEA_DAEGAL_76 [Mycobacterium phage Daegal]QNN98824.1 RuvC-like resolvase [Mycobacterium phage Hadrien]QOC58824.1 RuvC-like resolvase [Mycobacterium phage Luke]QUE25468.1 RuvC-like resolvase [Mycobacterium phage Luna22]QXO13823.1 RuvC-like resolvase [Mycobacterium phage Hail]QZD99118.1 RuvC-like resolvase [Mycobacterium phage Forge]WAA19523.1 RuvC-like resolvase [Mycobacterium phage Dewey]